MAGGKMQNFTKSSILQAIQKIKDNPDLRLGRESAEYDLIYQGTAYPPILVLSEGNKILGGGDVTLKDFNNNTDLAFRILRDIGFQIVKKARSDDINAALLEQAQLLETWPLSKLSEMRLDDYTNLARSSAFVYWMEVKSTKSGSIWGGSAYKFGIFRRADTTHVVDSNHQLSDGIYSWYSKYGESADGAWESVHDILLKIVNASNEGEFSKIDDIDLGDAYKWKIAYHYNPENIIPIFRREILVNAANSFKGDFTLHTPISELQARLMENKPVDITTFEFASRLWFKYSNDNIYHVVEQFLQQANTSDLKSKAYSKSFKGLKIKVSFGQGNTAKVPWIALLDSHSQVSRGIYPVYLYFKEIETLILAYGISETDMPIVNWPHTEALESINTWYNREHNTSAYRYGGSFIKAVYDLSEELSPEALQVDLDEIMEVYTSINYGEIDKIDDESPPYTADDRRYWLFAPGEGAKMWKEFQSESIAAIDWEDIGSLLNFTSKDDIESIVIELYGETGSAKMNTKLALWQFGHEVKVGDIIIPKKGKKYYLGYGIVSSTYRYDDTRPEYKHIIDVDWKKVGEWEEEVGSIVTKTFTDITQYPDYISRLRRLIGIEQEADHLEDKRYWWLNANPKHWRIEDFEVGDEQSYTSHNSNGNKRNKYEYFQKVKPGDLVLGYETTPTKKAIAVFEITKSLFIDEDDGEEKFSLIIQKFLSAPVPYQFMKQMPELQNSEVMRNNQGTLYSLSKAEFQSILAYGEACTDKLDEYTFEQATQEIYKTELELKEIVEILEKKKNIILQGPPGTGKTYIAKRLAYLSNGFIDSSKVQMIQFHQSYAYEDFIQGYRPTPDGGFALKNGVFYRFCKKASNDPDNNYYFIIDEINRGNLSKIFGELMMLIENDKRGVKFALPLTYSEGLRENTFYIPENLHIIGTMNTADRSLAIVDYALRRRFAFIDIMPQFENGLKSDIIDSGVDEAIAEKIVSIMVSLNGEISKDSNLGHGYQVGHSYFCNNPGKVPGEEWLESIIKYEVAPLLREYWFDNIDLANSHIRKLSK